MRHLALSIPLLVTLSVSAGAASLSVSPTRVELGPDTRSGALTLQNDADAPVTVQVQTFAWPRSAATDDLEPTRELLAVPPVFSLAPKAKQIIRVALRKPPAGQREQAYRLLITEVPEPPGGGGAAVRFALRLSLPVFATPPGARPLAAWSLGGSLDAPTLTLANAGTAHIQVRRIELRRPAREEVLQVIDAPAYVLPGGSRAWPLAAAARGISPLRLVADTDLGPLEADLASSPR